MRYYKIFFVLIAVIFFAGCASPEKALDRSLRSNRNVCKKLSGKVLVYVVFVDTKGGPKWNEAEINSTIGIYQDALTWVDSMASEHGVSLSFQLEFPGVDKIVKQDFPIKNVSSMITYEQKDIKRLNSWSNSVSKKIGVNMNLPNEKDSMPTVISPKDTERLIARLRNQYNTESVAVFYTTNHEEASAVALPLNTLDNENIEYVINSYKKSNIIAFELLTLFGADQLFYTKNGHSKKSEEYAAKEFPYDLMLNPFQNLEEAKIGEYTKYLIGWSDELDKRHQRLLKY